MHTLPPFPPCTDEVGTIAGIGNSNQDIRIDQQAPEEDEEGEGENRLRSPVEEGPGPAEEGPAEGERPNNNEPIHEFGNVLVAGKEGEEQVLRSNEEENFGGGAVGKAGPEVQDRDLPEDNQL